MPKVNLLLIFGIIVLVPFVICGTHTFPKYYSNNNYRRAGFNNNDMMEPTPAYYPVYNHSVQEPQGMPAPSEQLTASGYSYQPPPPAMESADKPNNNGYLPPSTSYGVPDAKYSSYGSSNNYGPPSGSYGSEIVYETPSSAYGSPPSSAYGSPASSPPTYGPPSPSYPTAPGYQPHMPAPHYGPPITPPPMMMVATTDQKSHEGLMEKFIKKIDLVLLSKMLLKLIIFKKIIKFIAVICLLMFIPVLKKKFEDSYATNEDEERHARNPKILDAYASVDFRVKEVANFALTAIEAFESHDIRWCVGESEFYCRLQYMLDAVDNRYPGNRVLGLWFPNLVTTTTSTAAPPTESTTSSSKKVNFNDHITESPMSSIETSHEDDNLVKK